MFFSPFNKWLQKFNMQMRGVTHRRDMMGKTMPIYQFVPISISDAAHWNDLLFRILNG